MLRKVRSNADPVTWPGGSVRALPGQVFEDWTDHPSSRVRAIGKSLLLGQARKTRKVETGRATAGSNPPDDVLDRLRNALRDDESEDVGLKYTKPRPPRMTRSHGTH